MSPDDSTQHDITILHAEDDYDIPWEHSNLLYWHAVNASLPHGICYEELEEEKVASRSDLQAGGWVVDQQTQKGRLQEAIANLAFTRDPNKSFVPNHLFHFTTI
ncbi:hypothetical protein TrVFT333_005307 [Trichoderma virens FT-333]|nr:hypothetical protein TrVFT333_005307 [Trichoderma virens FT-333]